MLPVNLQQLYLLLCAVNKVEDLRDVVKSHPLHRRESRFCQHLRGRGVIQALLHDLVLVDVAPEDTVCGDVEVHGNDITHSNQRQSLDCRVRCTQIQADDPFSLGN